MHRCVLEKKKETKKETKKENKQHSFVGLTINGQIEGLEKSKVSMVKINRYALLTISPSII